MKKMFVLSIIQKVLYVIQVNFFYKFLGNLINNSQVSTADGKNNTKIYLLVGHAGPDYCIFMWDLESRNIKARFDIGANSEITSILALQDGHTFMVSTEEGSIIVFDVSYQRYIKKFWPGTAKINLQYQFNDLSHFAAGCEDGNIYIMKLSYHFVKEFNRAVFRDANILHNLRNNVPVVAMNESHLNPNTFQSGGPDGKVYIWDSKYSELKKTIDIKGSGVSSLVVIENPMNYDTFEDYFILCFGEEKGDVCVSQPKYDKLFELQFSLETEFHKDITRQPRLQLYKRGGNTDEEGFGLITFSNSGDKRCLITVNLK